jgi:hypothetical protein
MVLGVESALSWISYGLLVANNISDLFGEGEMNDINEVELLSKDVDARLAVIDRDLHLFCDETNRTIDRLCKEINSRMQWMKTGVLLAIVPAVTALFVAAYLVWRFRQ